MKAATLFCFFSLFFAGCAHRPVTLLVETKPPKWQPRLLIDSSTVVGASNVSMNFLDGGVSYDLHERGAAWELNLDDNMIEQLLRGQDRQLLIVQLKYREKTSKAARPLKTKFIQVMIDRSAT